MVASSSGHAQIFAPRWGMENKGDSGMFARLSLSSTVVLSLLLVSSCAPVDKTTYYDSRSDIPAYDPNRIDSSDKEGPMSFLALGRALSGGAVDIYEPDAAQFSVVAPEARKSLSGDTSIPANPRYTPMDSDVIFYSLALPSKDLDVIEPQSLPVPMPLFNGDR